MRCDGQIHSGDLWLWHGLLVHRDALRKRWEGEIDDEEESEVKGQKRGNRVQKRNKLEEREKKKERKGAVGILEFLQFPAIILTSNKRAVRSGRSAFLCKLRLKPQTRVEKTFNIFILPLNTLAVRACIEPSWFQDQGKLYYPMGGWGGGVVMWSTYICPSKQINKGHPPATPTHRDSHKHQQTVTNKHSGQC